MTSAANLQSFRFFTNDFDTETKGLDVVATYEADLFGGQSSLSLAFNNNQTEVTALQSRYAECIPHPAA